MAFFMNKKGRGRERDKADIWESSSLGGLLEGGFLSRTEGFSSKSLSLSEPQDSLHPAYCFGRLREGVFSWQGHVLVPHRTRISGVSTRKETQ